MDNITTTATQYADMMVVLVADYGIDVLGGVIMLIVGWTIAGWARRAVDRGLGRIERIEVTLRKFLASAAVINYSHHTTRRVALTVGIDYGDDIDKAFATIRGILAADARIHAEPETFLAVAELADNSVNIVIRGWCDAGEYWPLKFALTKAIKKGLAAAGISIPFPQRVVHVVGSREPLPAAQRRRFQCFTYCRQ